MMIDDSSADALSSLAFQESPVAQTVTKHRCIAELNKSLSSLFGFARHDLIGRSARMLYPSIADFERIGQVCEATLRQSTTPYYEDQRFMQSRDGSVFWARARGVTLSSARDPFAMMIWSFDKVEERAVPSDKLTRREREIAPLIGQGLTSRQIGDRLSISHRTVEVHRARLMSKLRVRNAAELVSHLVVNGSSDS